MRPSSVVRSVCAGRPRTSWRASLSTRCRLTPWSPTRCCANRPKAQGVGPATHPYGELRRGDEVFRLRQEWTWESSTHYQVAFIVEKEAPNGPTALLRTVTRYYALSIPRLLELMAGAGFADCRRLDDVIYQPIVIGRAA